MLPKIPCFLCITSPEELAVLCSCRGTKWGRTMRNIRSNISPYEDVLGGLAKFTISLSNGSSLPEKEVPDFILFEVFLSLGGTTWALWRASQSSTRSTGKETMAFREKKNEERKQRGRTERDYGSTFHAGCRASISPPCGARLSSYCLGLRSASALITSFLLLGTKAA